MSDALAAVLRADPPLARVLTFSRRFGRETTVLAMHAALPLGLSPELVHLLRINFVREAPFIAEADLLLSPLCAEVGGGMYEMDADVRELLLAEMARTPGYGPWHVRRVAHFLRVWAGRALDETADPDVREHLRVQQWVAMAYADPARAAEALAGALRTGVESRDRSEVARVARLTTVLSAPLAAQVELRRYAGAVEALAGGATATADDDTGEVAVGAARLPGLNRVVRLWNPDLDFDETAQQQTDPFGQPFSDPDAPRQQEQSADTPHDASAEHGYRIARVLVIGPVQVGKQSLLGRMGTEPFRAARSGGVRASGWRAWTGSARGAAHHVVFYEPEPDGGAFDLLVEESAAILLVLSGREDDATVQSWMATASGGRPAMVVVTGQGAEVRVQEFLGIAARSGIRGPVLWTDGEDVEHVKDAIRHLVPWGQLPAADSPEEVDWLERQLDGHFGDLPVAEWDEANRYQISRSMRIAHADPDAALERAVACLQASGSIRVAGDPPWAIARGEAFERCVAEIWRGAAAHHDVSDLPSVPMAWLEARFSAPEFRGFLDANPTPGVLDLVLRELSRRRWIFQADTHRGPMVVVPSRFSLGSRQTYAPPDEFQPLVRATWAGYPENSLFVLLLVRLADLGRVDVRMPDLAYVVRDEGMLRVQWSGEEGRMALSIDRARGTRQADFFEQGPSVVRDADLVQQLFYDVLERYLPAGTRPQIEEFSDAPDAQPPAEAAEPPRKKAAPRKKASQSAIPEAEPGATPVGAFPPEPPEGVNLRRACLVLIPRGRKKVGRRSVDFDALWTHLLEPAIRDTRFPDGESLVPVRAWELPKAGTPLPNWTRGARMVVADVTALGLAVLRELRLLPSMRAQTVLLLREAGAPMFTDIASTRTFIYEGGTTKELAAQRDRVSAALALALGMETADAKPADTLIITADSLNVREGPATRHPAVGVLPKGARVRRLESIPDWYRVQADDGLTGWISAKFAEPLETGPDSRLRVTAVTLNLRAGSGREHPTVKQLPRGLLVNEIGRSRDGAWIQVHTPGGFEGWASSQHLESAQGADPFAPRKDDPPWYVIAWHERAQREVDAPGDNPRILDYLSTVSFKTGKDEVPWAAAFVEWTMRQAGIRGSGHANAGAWLNWGQKLKQPRRGCIVVLSRPGVPGPGYVGFFAGQKGTQLELLGGTQEDQVKVAGFDKSRLLSYRWPAS